LKFILISFSFYSIISVSLKYYGLALGSIGFPIGFFTILKLNKKFIGYSFIVHILGLLCTMAFAYYIGIKHEYGYLFLVMEAFVILIYIGILFLTFQLYNQLPSERVVEQFLMKQGGSKSFFLF
jgi:hypothetical protein